MDAEQKFSPKEFLRKRRPERFTDSIVEEKGNLDRAFLEYFLSTLNSRSQELQFETFSKAICEKVVCSNLLEQTGPVAGGDGKTDTQTFPVSEQNRLMWYEGINESSHKERWAFGVSTRKDWKAKCKEDVKKIVGTNRGYVKAFNLTNQFVKSDQRSDLEDSLSKEFDIDVRVLDRSWLLDQVFKNNLQDIAIETLSIPVSYERNVTLGVGDYRKDTELEDLNRRITSEVEPKDILFEQVDWFLQVAELSTELEKPEMECRGLYERAINVAGKFGSNQQQLDAYYSYAWKAHFWLEDIELVEDNLVKAVKCIADSTSSSKWEKIVTLLNLYNGHLKITGHESNIDIENINKSVVEKLKEIASDETKPSNALLADTHIETLKLSSMTYLNDAAPIFINIKSIVEKSQNLIGYPFDTVFNLFNEMGDIFDEVTEYEELMDCLIDNSSKRDGEIQGAIKYLKRGLKRLESDKPYQAITQIGKALTGLYKEESRREVILGLNAMSVAYQRVGLIWAARASCLFASSLLIDEFWKRDHLNDLQIKSFMQLCWLELHLGRLGQALQWYELVLVVQAQYGQPVIEDSEILNLDGFISHIVLNTRLNVIKELAYVPNALERLGLHVSEVFLKFALGHEQDIQDLYKNKNQKEMMDYFLLVRDYDFGIDTPVLDILKEKRGNLHTSVLGCTIHIDFPFRTPYLEMSESILSMIESFFATGPIQKLHAKEAKLTIEIVADDDDGMSIEHEFDDSGSEIQVQVTCCDFEVDTINQKAQKILHDWVGRFLIEVLCNAFYVKDHKSFAEQLLGEDKGLERAISFSSSFAASYNVIGKESLEDARKFFSDDSLPMYRLNRKRDWDSEHPKRIKSKKRKAFNRPDSGPTQEDMELEKLSHGDISVQSLIKPRLWDRTTWKGIGFSMYPDGVPGIDLIFEDEIAGEKIFSDLLTEVGARNDSNRLQINILKGISNKHPNNYRVQIFEDFPPHSSSRLTTFVSRLNTMTPSTAVNLNNFVEEFEKHGICRLSYGAIHKGHMFKSSSSNNSYIELKAINIKNAWEVEINSIESTAIREDEEPLIPDDIDDAPVLKVIEQRKKIQN